VTARTTTAVVTCDLPAAQEVVYDEWLDRESLMEWMCPHPARPVSIEIEPVVGGSLRFDIDDEGSPMVVTGTYLTLDRPRRIEFTWNCSTWPRDQQDSVVSVTFEAVDHQTTRMTIEHSRLATDLADRHQQGWAAIAEQLANQLG